jgi:hypothetical protein
MRQNVAMRARSIGLLLAAAWSAPARADLAQGAAQRSGPPLDHALEAACAAGADELWAAGDEGEVARFDGRGWSAQPSGTQEYLRAIACADGEVFIVGDAGTILRGHAGALSPSPSGTGQDLRGVWAAGARDAWAVGDGLTILHWDGARWSSVPAPPLAAILDAAARQDTTARDPIPDLPLPAPPGDRAPRAPAAPALLAIWGSSPRDVWAVGRHGLVLRWDGERWSLVENRVPDSLGAIWGASARDVWAAGGGYRDPRGTVEGSVLLHWDGARFALQPTRAVRSLGPLGGDGRDLFAGGGDGLWRRRGKSWALVPGFERTDGQRFRAVAILARARGGLWLVGDGGQLVRWDGRRFVVAWQPNN